MIEDVMLTKEERKKLIGRLIVENQCGETRNIAVCKAQCLKLLDVMEEQGLIRCDYLLEYEEYLNNGKDWHKPDCRVCELRKELR